MGDPWLSWHQNCYALCYACSFRFYPLLCHLRRQSCSNGLARKVCISVFVYLSTRMTCFISAAWVKRSQPGANGFGMARALRVQLRSIPSAIDCMHSQSAESEKSEDTYSAHNLGVGQNGSELPGIQRILKRADHIRTKHTIHQITIVWRTDQTRHFML